ncbi:MAG TPA: hypothetical protein VLL98_02365 [Rickettsiales bacterium]|nr:hypothetical protein [Rickettsiales bacterium]
MSEVKNDSNNSLINSKNSSSTNLKNNGLINLQSTNLQTNNSTDLIIHILAIAIIRLSLKNERQNKHL